MYIKPSNTASAQDTFFSLPLNLTSTVGSLLWMVGELLHDTWPDPWFCQSDGSSKQDTCFACTWLDLHSLQFHELSRSDP